MSVPNDNIQRIIKKAEGGVRWICDAQCAGFDLYYQR